MKHAIVIIGTRALAVAAFAGCGSDDRAPFEAAAVPPPPSAPGDPTSYQPGAPSSPRCDPDTLASTHSLAGCRFVTTSSTFTSFNNTAPAGCHPLVVTNPSTVPAHLRLRFKEREEDAAAYAVLAHVNGRDVSYAPLNGGVLGPDESAIVSIIFIGLPPGEPSTLASFCPTKAFVESDEPAARADTVTSAIELLSDSPVLVTGVHEYQLAARPVGAYGGQSWTAVYPLFPTHLWEKNPIETGIQARTSVSAQYRC